MIAIDHSRTHIVRRNNIPHRVGAFLIPAHQPPQVSGARIDILCRNSRIGAELLRGVGHQLHESDRTFSEIAPQSKFDSAATMLARVAERSRHDSSGGGARQSVPAFPTSGDAGSEKPAIFHVVVPAAFDAADLAPTGGMLEPKVLEHRTARPGAPPTWMVG